MNILQYIPKGRENAISRESLERMTRLPDRENRKIIRQAREKGIAIISSSSGKGYWLSDNPAEIRQLSREYMRRGESNYNAACALAKNAAKREGEDVVLVRPHFRRIKRREIEGQTTLERRQQDGD